MKSVKAKAAIGSLILFGITLMAAVVAFVAYPGCATPAKPPPPDGEVQRNLYDSALRRLEEMKGRGGLAGIESTASGKFSGKWLWYDRTNRSDHQIQFVFDYSDGRPGKRIAMTYSVRNFIGWQIMSIKD